VSGHSSSQLIQQGGKEPYHLSSFFFEGEGKGALSFSFRKRGKGHRGPCGCFSHGQRKKKEGGTTAAASHDLVPRSRSTREEEKKGGKEGAPESYSEIVCRRQWNRCRTAGQKRKKKEGEKGKRALRFDGISMGAATERYQAGLASHAVPCYREEERGGKRRKDRLVALLSPLPSICRLSRRRERGERKGRPGIMWLRFRH